jgi:CheY-like chemotaxis protein
VEVADDGPGIPLGVQPRVFEPFFTTKSEGTGLGLSIAQGIVQQHGGSISFESRPGQGSRFFVDLPIVATAEATAMAEDAEPRTIASRHILVVEDEPAVAAFIAKVLQRSGHHVTMVANGQEALAALADARPDLIISDVKMPTMRGDQFFAEVQVLYPDLAGRVIFITGDIADQRTVVFLEETQQPRLVKPFSATELRRVVARVAK